MEGRRRRPNPFSSQGNNASNPFNKPQLFKKPGNKPRILVRENELRLNFVMIFKRLEAAPWMSRPATSISSLKLSTSKSAIRFHAKDL